MKNGVISRHKSGRKASEKWENRRKHEWNVLELKQKLYKVSRTQDLVDQIKQITIEIRDIKERRKNKINSSNVQNTFNVHNRIRNGPLQEGHEEHDEDDVHYDDSKQNDHQLLDNTNSQICCVPIHTGGKG